jgi:hypothetical protein
MSVDSLVSRLAALEASGLPLPAALHFNVRSTVQDPILSSSPLNSPLVGYSADLNILDVEAVNLSKSNVSLTSLLRLALLRAEIANKLRVVQEHIRHVYSFNISFTGL